MLNRIYIIWIGKVLSQYFLYLEIKMMMARAETRTRIICFCMIKTKYTVVSKAYKIQIHHQSPVMYCESFSIEIWKLWVLIKYFAVNVRGVSPHYAHNWRLTLICSWLLFYIICISYLFRIHLKILWMQKSVCMFRLHILITQPIVIKFCIIVSGLKKRTYGPS